MVEKTSLEDLSNELLIDIFQYVLLYDLHRGLYNLNRRLNAICEVQKLYVNIFGSKHAFDYYCSHQQPFASQIYSLTLYDYYDRLRIFCQYNNIELFINSRMLTIRTSAPQHLGKI